MEETRTKNIRVLLLSRVEKQRKKLMGLTRVYNRILCEEEKEVLHYVSSLYLVADGSVRERYEKEAKKRANELEKGKITIKGFNLLEEESLKLMEKKIREEKPESIERSQEVLFPEIDALVSLKNQEITGQINLILSGILEMASVHKCEASQEEKKQETSRLIQKLDSLYQFTLKKLEEIKSPNISELGNQEIQSIENQENTKEPVPGLGKLLISSSLLIYLPFSFLSVFDLFTASHLKVLIEYIAIFKNKKSNWILSIFLGLPFHFSIFFLYIICTMLANSRYTRAKPLIPTLSLFFLQGILSFTIFCSIYLSTKNLIVLGASYTYHEYFLLSFYFLSALIMHICQSIYKKSKKEAEPFPKYLFSLTASLSYLSTIYLILLATSTIFSIIRVYGLNYSSTTIIPQAVHTFSRLF
ncbi:hypothetical protein NEFER03_0120 [Nematocida sp. LUAm3]|nr:hypothetical protein NEFER03_0120 [Nematocida sp. LUAm3]KAI5173573.1 hypothetical protein NEFER02_0089 [Nematocida sp. LUAm2]KAI5176794.1 hypothetical protein NEFER01_0119 [Nematocida sp. LUAm1]